MSKETAATLDDVVLQLKINNRLLAAQITASDSVSRESLLAALGNTGAPNALIGELLGMTPNAVAVALSRLRHKDNHEASAKSDGDKEAKK